MKLLALIAIAYLSFAAACAWGIGGSIWILHMLVTGGV